MKGSEEFQLLNKFDNDYWEEPNEDNIKLYEFGAHFKYDDLFKRLESFSERENYKEKNKTLKIYNLNSQQSRNINLYIPNKKSERKGNSEISNELSIGEKLNNPKYKMPAVSSLTITEHAMKEQKPIEKAKNKNIISKKPFQIIAQIDLRNDKKNSKKNASSRPAKSASQSKKKDNINEIAAIKRKNISPEVKSKQNAYYNNNINININNQRQKRLSNSYQNFSLKKKTSPSFIHSNNNINNNNVITNIKFNHQNCKPSPQQKKPSKSNPNLVNDSFKRKPKTSVLNFPMAKSRNCNQKRDSKRNNNKNIIKKNMKISPNKVGLTFHKSEVSKFIKKNDTIQKEYQKPKPRSQEKPKINIEKQQPISLSLSKQKNMNKKDKCFMIHPKLFNDKQTKNQSKNEKSINYSTKINSSKSSSHPQLEIKVQLIQNDKKELSKPHSKNKEIKRKIFNNITSLQIGSFGKSSSTSKKTSRNNRSGTSSSKHQIINSTTKTQNNNYNKIGGNIFRNVPNDKHKILSSNNKHISKNDLSKLKTKSNSLISTGSKVSGNLNKQFNNINTNILKNCKQKNEITQT